MLTREDILAFLREHKEELMQEYQLTKLGIFGSFARDEAHEKSDIDLLVDFQSDTPKIYRKTLAMKDLLKATFGREVDICTEEFIKPYFKDRILKNAIYV